MEPWGKRPPRLYACANKAALPDSTGDPAGAHGGGLLGGAAQQWAESGG